MYVRHKTGLLGRLVGLVLQFVYITFDNLCRKLVALCACTKLTASLSWVDVIQFHVNRSPTCGIVPL